MTTTTTTEEKPYMFIVCIADSKSPNISEREVWLTEEQFNNVTNKDIALIFQRLGNEAYQTFLGD
jgi:hypothetical protein